MNQRVRRILAALFVAIAGLVSVVIVVDGPDGQPVLTYTIGAKANQFAPEIVIDEDNKVSAAERRDSADATPIDEGPGIHEDARDEQPFGAPPEAGVEVVSTPVPGIGEPLPLGGAQNYSCVWKPVRNHSARTAGAKVSMVNLHVAVVRPFANANPIIRRLFDMASFGASSHIGLELDGDCEQWVAYNRKAWTQGAFNSVSESVEIMAMGTETRAFWLAQPILKRGILAAWVADRLRANGLPPRFVDPEGCTPKAGFTDHDRLECGNSHVDVGHGFPFDVFERQVRRSYYGGNPVPIPCTPRNVERVVAKRRPEFRIIVDGVIGNRTRAAIRAVQKGNYLRVDGVVGPITGRKLGLEGCR